MQEKRALGTVYVMFKAFLSDGEKIWGITGLRWPDGEEIQVRYEEHDRAQAGPSFETLCRPDYQGRTLDCGAMLRMPLCVDPFSPGGFTTDCPHVLTYDQSESERLMRFGHGHVRVFTPKEVSSKRHWLEASPKGREIVEANLAKAPGLSREAMLEELEKAENYIFMEFFIIEEGYMWGRILDILTRKAKEGVMVRVMYDGMC